MTTALKQVKRDSVRAVAFRGRVAREWESEIMTDQSETPMDLVRDYIAEGEARCARLVKMLEKMEGHASIQDTQSADRLLAVLDRTLMLLQKHLKEEQALCSSDAEEDSH